MAEGRALVVLVGGVYVVAVRCGKNRDEVTREVDEFTGPKEG